MSLFGKIFKTGLKVGGKTLKINPLTAGLSVLGGVAGAFNKDRYKSEYHGATQEIKEQLKQQDALRIVDLNSRAISAALAKKQGRNVFPVDPVLPNYPLQSNQKKDMSTMYVVGASLLALVGVFVLKNKNKTSKLA